MLQEGLGTPEEIDKAIKLGLNYPMGPFELVDLVGLDARLNNLKYLHEKLGEKYRPAPLLEQYVKAGRLGRKSGKGVYDYTERIRGGVKMREVVIVDAVRTPIGRYKGALKSVRPDDLRCNCYQGTIRSKS